MQTWLDIEKIGDTTGFLGMVYLDYVLYQKKWETKSPFTFMSIFDSSVFALLFLLPLLCALICSVRNFQNLNEKPKTILCANSSFKKLRKLNTFIKRFLENTFFFFASFFNSPSINRKQFAMPFIIVFWLFTVFVLTQFYTGEMFSELTRSNQLIVVNSWIDLARINDVQIVAQSPELTYKVGDENDYFNPELSISKKLVNRLKLIGFTEFYDHDYIENLTRSLVNNEIAFMAPQGFLYYTLHHVDEGIHTETLHVSKEGGDAQPYYLLSTFLANIQKKEAVAFV